MTAQHTPGPWTQGTSENGVECVWLDGHTESVRGMGDDGTWIDCNTEANARLIAAAPELLESLKSAIARQAYRPGEGPDWWEQGRAAIAKATGGAA